MNIWDAKFYAYPVVSSKLWCYFHSVHVSMELML